MNAMSFPRREGGGRPPSYARAVDCLRAALPAIAPHKRMPVADAAETYRRISTMGNRVPWRNDVVPYMVEPMNMTASRRFRSAVFVGPARCAKTDGMILNTLAHRIVCQPCNARVIHMDRTSAREFSLEKIEPMIRVSPEVESRQTQGKGSDNIFEKRFVGGMRLSIGWPVRSHLSASDIPLVAFSDYDRMPEDIGGEGDPFSMGRKRSQTFGTLGMTIAESSPGRPILDEDWKPSPSAPHMAPPTTGILSLYNQGTRGRYYWTCPSCGVDFEPDTDRLQWPKEGSPAERAVGVYMVCPSGCILEPEAKRDLNIGGRWLHEAADGSLVPIDEDVRETDIVSWWLLGAAAAFQSWRELVANYLNAVETFRLTGDEEPLKTTTNVDHGKPYRPRALGTGADLSVTGLKGRADRYPLGIAPAAARFVTAQIDVQANRFVVQVDAWGEGLERWMIDRFDIHVPPASSPSPVERAIDPARYREDWDALWAILDRVYPVEGTGFGLMPVALIVDSGGAPGVTQNAYSFFRRSRKRGLARRVFLAKGVGGFGKPRAVEVVPEKESGRRTKKRSKGISDLTLVQVGTDALKDEVSACLSREEPGPGAYHLSDQFEDHVFEELCAERRTASGWERKPGLKRNEALDLAVYGKALTIVLKAERFDWQAPPAWASPVAMNEFAVLMPAPAPETADPSSNEGTNEAAAQEPVANVHAPVPVPARPRPAKPARRVTRSSFLGR